jgi:hypothetical protein
MTITRGYGLQLVHPLGSSAASENCEQNRRCVYIANRWSACSLRASFVTVAAAVWALPRDPAGVNGKLEAVLGRWLDAHDECIGYKKVGGLESAWIAKLDLR